MNERLALAVKLARRDMQRSLLACQAAQPPVEKVLRCA